MKHTRRPPQADQKNMFLAILCAAVLIVGWQIVVEGPKRQALQKWNKQQEEKKIAQTFQAQEEEGLPAKILTREERLAQAPRLAIQSDKLRGTLSLKGLRLDDLTLSHYLAHLDPAAEALHNARVTSDRWVHSSTDNKVILLSPSGDESAYFMQAGWLAAGGSTKVPDENSVWKADGETLTPEKPVTLRWDNGQGVEYVVVLSMDNEYMFAFDQQVNNRSGKEIAVSPYAFVNRAYTDPSSHNYILHEGPLGVLDQGVLTEVAYKDLRENGKQTYQQEKPGWLGFTDKYWLTSLVPAGTDYTGSFDYYRKQGQDRYQAEYAGQPVTVPAGGNASQHLRFFAGAKELPVLDAYAKGNPANSADPIPLFDRAVDFGVLYFLTKPIFQLLNWLYVYVGNFGVAIMLLTVIVKLLMFPLATKGYHSTAQMRLLQPQLEKLRKECGEDKVKLQQETLKLYKREKVNPAAGCLPIIIQIPVFFALYKVLFVTIEMRHAPFFGWIHDLSSADPSNLFTLFGLIPWNAPPMFHLGILPILMCLTMVVQMKQQPKPSDPVQAKMIKIMPYFFLIMFATMPAGLVLYWTWSNTLSIAQQWMIARGHRNLTARQTALSHAKS